ncbi:hypothetical protein [Galactobacter sp.]|uniref:hypothetical protein n=1 Tax=Galactobacter sp. TaxID=2676125 RepID=UPI0025BEB876|nr:hypothetical protein [Galactobacter sp.]
MTDFDTHRSLRLTRRNRHLARLGAALTAGLLATASLAACSGSEDDPAAASTSASTAKTALGPDTKCSDYLGLSEEDQVRVIQNTSRELDDEFISSAQALTAVDSIKQFCRQDDLKDGTMRDIAEPDQDGQD